MHNRQKHRQEVLDFLHENLSLYDWKFSLPPGHGRESYIAHGFKRNFFVKVDVPIERYVAMAETGLTPPVFVHGQLESGLSVIVQPMITGHKPSQADYYHRWSEVADVIHKLHTDPKIRSILPASNSESYKDAAIRAIADLREKWTRYRQHAIHVADFIDSRLDSLDQNISQFSGDGLVAMHGDICNANWLFASDGKIYLLDLESMSMDDPAFDMGALLWWYYPPYMRQQFLTIAGYPYDDEFKFRMRIRMAMHCLNILLPREDSFDTFEPDTFDQALADFRAVLNGQENPQGYIEQVTP